MRLRFRGNLSSPYMAELFADREHFTLSYCVSAEGEYRPFDNVKKNGDFVEIGSLEEIPSIEKNEKQMTVLKLELTRPVQQDIMLRGIELFGGDCALRPDFIWNGRNETRTDSEAFCPFTKQPALYDECLIGQDFLFGQPGWRRFWILGWILADIRQSGIWRRDRSCRLSRKERRKMQCGATTSATFRKSP